MSSTVDKYMENKTIQYQEKDIKNKQVNSEGQVLIDSVCHMLLPPAFSRETTGTHLMVS